jgi:hypothetical protein
VETSGDDQGSRLRRKTGWQRAPDWMRLGPLKMRLGPLKMRLVPLKMSLMP